MKMKEIKCTIQGRTPLLCNRFSDETAQDIEGGSSISLNGDRGAPKDQAEKKLYLGDNGKPGIPQPNLFRCIIDAGTYFKNGKSKVTTLKSSLIPACVELDGLILPIQTKKGWTVDTRPIRNPATGGRRLCYRPCFHDWELSFVLRVDTSIMPLGLMRDIVDAAGTRIGLGDFRPDRKGPFGKFLVTNWKVAA